MLEALAIVAIAAVEIRGHRRRRARRRWLQMIERSVAERLQLVRAVALTADPSRN